MDTHVEALQVACPAGLAQEIISLNFASDRDFQKSNEAIRKVEESDDCAVAFARFFAAKYADSRDRRVEARLLSVMLRLPPPRRDEASQEISRALQIMPLSDDIARGYFTALRTYGLDLRDKYEGQFPAGSVDDWHSAAIFYYMYLADLQDLRGLQELDRAVSASEDDPHALNGMLLALRWLERADASPIFRRYLDDQRRGIGVRGAGTGPSVSQVAQMGLQAMVR